MKSVWHLAFCIQKKSICSSKKGRIVSILYFLKCFFFVPVPCVLCICLHMSSFAQVSSRIGQWCFVWNATWEMRVPDSLAIKQWCAECRLLFFSFFFFFGFFDSKTNEHPAHFRVYWFNLPFALINNYIASEEHCKNLLKLFRRDWWTRLPTIYLHRYIYNEHKMFGNCWPIAVGFKPIKEETFADLVVQFHSPNLYAASNGGVLYNVQPG